MKLQVQNVSYSYDGKPALRGVSLAVEAGECLLLLGPSGCGKTTLLKLIAGILEPDAGEIRRDGSLLSSLPIQSRRVGLVMEEWALYPHKSVFRNISFPLELRHLGRDRINAEVHRVAARLGLSEFLTRRPDQLSAGQRQRVALARSLVRDDLTVLLGDEPFSNVDPTLRRSLRREFRDVSKEFKLATIIVTHDQSDATMADRVAVMFDGRLHQIGAFDEIYARPADLRVAQFVGLVPPNLIPAPLLYPDWPDASQYTLALRPEAITVSSDLNGQIAGSVVAVEQMPPLQWIEVETQVARLLVADPMAAHPIASRVGLRWEQQSVQWFLSATGQRCDAPRATSK